MVITIAPANSSRMVRCICETTKYWLKTRHDLTNTYLVVEVTIDLRRRFVQDYNVTASQNCTGHCDQLTFTSTERAGLTDGHVQRNLVRLLCTLEGAFEYSGEMTSLEDVPALLVGVFVEGV